MWEAAVSLVGSSHLSAPFSQIHKERQILIFRVHQGKGQSEPGEYEHRLSLQDSVASLALSHVTPHDERMFLCKSKRPRLQDHYVELQVFSECPPHFCLHVDHVAKMGSPCFCSFPFHCRSPRGANYSSQCRGHPCGQARAQGGERHSVK